MYQVTGLVVAVAVAADTVAEFAADKIAVLGFDAAAALFEFSATARDAADAGLFVAREYLAQVVAASLSVKAVVRVVAPAGGGAVEFVAVVVEFVAVAVVAAVVVVAAAPAVVEFVAAIVAVVPAGIVVVVAAQVVIASDLDKNPPGGGYILIAPH